MQPQWHSQCLVWHIHTATRQHGFSQTHILPLYHSGIFPTWKTTSQLLDYLLHYCIFNFPSNAKYSIWPWSGGPVCQELLCAAAQRTQSANSLGWVSLRFRQFLTYKVISNPGYLGVLLHLKGDTWKDYNWTYLNYRNYYYICILSENWWAIEKRGLNS